MKPSLQKWFDTLPIKSEEARNALKTQLEDPEVEKIVEESVMLRSDYSRTMNEGQQKVQKALQDAEQLKTSYATFRQQEEAKVQQFYKENRAALAKANAEKTAYATRLTALVNEGVVSPEEAAIAQDEFLAAQNAAALRDANAGANPDPVRKVVTEEKLKEALGSSQTQFVHAIGTINDIADRHFDLFGKRLNRAELIQATYAAGGNKTVIDVWKEKYGVETREAELAAAAHKKELDDAIAEALVRDRSERAIAGETAPYSSLDSGGDKHILSIFSAKDGKARAMGVSPAVAKASEAYRRNQALKGAGNTSA